MRTCRLILLLVGPFVIGAHDCSGGVRESQPGAIESKKKPPPANQIQEELRNVKDPDQLLALALKSCTSTDSAALATVIEAVKDPYFCDRLDPDGEEKPVVIVHGKPPPDFLEPMRLQKLMYAIASLPGEVGCRSILAIAESKTFTSQMKVGKTGPHQRMEALIIACGNVRNPSPELLTFMDRKLAEDNYWSSRVICAWVRMRSEAACPKLEQRVKEANDKLGGEMRGFYVEVLFASRNEPTTVDLYKRLISGNIKDAGLRNTIVQTVFDYRPREWYGINAPRVERYLPVPNRHAASTVVLRELMNIANPDYSFRSMKMAFDRV
jgi:hypothetical protein